MNLCSPTVDVVKSTKRQELGKVIFERNLRLSVGFKNGQVAAHAQIGKQSGFDSNSSDFSRQRSGTDA